MARLAHVHRQPRLVAEVDVILDGLGRGVTAVAVAGVHDVVVKLPVGEHEEVRVPAGTAQQDDVVGVHLADGFDGTLVERFEQLVQFVLVLEVVRYRLVHQFVAQDHGLVLVAGSDALPDVNEQLLARLALEQPRIAVTVIDVVAGLPTRAVVHVENQVEARGPAPIHHRVDAGKSVLLPGAPHVILIGEESVVEGQTDGVGTLTRDETDVGAGDVVVLELAPEVGGKVRTHGLLDHQVNHPRRVGLAQAEHIALGVEPVAQVGALDIQFLAVGLHQVCPFYMDKIALGLLCVKPQGKYQRE